MVPRFPNSIYKFNSIYKCPDDEYMDIEAVHILKQSGYPVSKYQIMKESIYKKVLFTINPNANFF